MYFDTYGLLNSRPDEVNAENSLLWTFEYILLLRHMGLDTNASVEALKRAINDCKLGKPGIYAQNPSYVANKPLIASDEHMSPDQLITITGFSYLYGLEHHKLVWQEIKNQWFRYDNITPDKPKYWIHPRDLIYYGILGGSIIARLFLPLYFIMIILSCTNEKMNTSTKILTFVKLHVIRNRFVAKICNMLIKRRNNDWNDVFRIYFPDINHPIHKLVDQGKIINV